MLKLRSYLCRSNSGRSNSRRSNSRRSNTRACLLAFSFAAASLAQDAPQSGGFPALFNLGYSYFTQQRFADAVPLLQRAAQMNAADFNAHYLLGAALSKLGKTDDALRAWREALHIQPANLRLMQVMAVEYSKGRYFGEGASLARQALALKTDDPNIYFLTIKAYQDSGDDTAAGEIAKRAAGLFPDSARANFEYAYQLQKQGAIDEAEKRFERAIAADASYEEPLFFYGNLLVDHDRSAEAIPFLRRAIQNRGDYVPARVLLARALLNENKLGEAISELQAAIALDAKHPQPHLLLSQIYFRTGEEAKAKSEKEISLRLRRENPTILEAAQPRPFPVN